MNGLVDESGRALLDLKIRSTGNEDPVVMTAVGRYGVQWGTGRPATHD